MMTFMTMTLIASLSRTWILSKSPHTKIIILMTSWQLLSSLWRLLWLLWHHHCHIWWQLWRWHRSYNSISHHRRLPETIFNQSDLINLQKVYLQVEKIMMIVMISMIMYDGSDNDEGLIVELFCIIVSSLYYLYT